ncbi:hypothetical protein ACOTJG_25655 [Achromobacter xylosoxidans]|uniref:hypothetical protein n=1 Tax=Alcaligenes xylosoxydans xylosoxydans TaxID=85698 RepID=UPI0006C8CA68|nr:hypothetical protein [Achromobacter xylosoxidans]
MDTSAPLISFKAFYLSLPAVERERFAKRAGTTVAYVETHLLYARKVPRKGTMDGLWGACQEFGAPFGRGDLLDFFYGGSCSQQEPPHA